MPRLVVAFSLVKGDRTEWAVGKLTELGADEIVPLICERTVVRAAGGGDQHRSARLRRIARQAAMQARRVHLPQVGDPLTFRDAVEHWPPGRACLGEPGGGPLGLDAPIVLVGPEGGWSPGEYELAEEHGLRRVGLGAHVLRVETAAVAAGAILGALRGGLAAEHPRNDLDG
ncbi:MAG: RsmE family RNA methyltransferase [Acidimicrobiales bacterium]